MENFYSFRLLNADAARVLQNDVVPEYFLDAKYQEAVQVYPF